MLTQRETILQTLLAALQTMPAVTVLRDGDPGTSEVTLSPLQYHYEHRAGVEAIAQGKTPAARDAAFDALLAELAVAIIADRTLGGLYDRAETKAPQPVDLPIEGAEALKASIVPVILTYTTADPLG